MKIMMQSKVKYKYHKLMNHQTMYSYVFKIHVVQNEPLRIW